MSARRVIVVGGGLAGMAAALDCADAGAEVTLLESRGRLGGQAYSFARDGLTADNGQHVFLRCCTAYIGLLGRFGALDLVELQPRLSIPVLSPGRVDRLQRNGLPAPLNLAGSLLRYGPLPPRDRLAVGRAMLALRRLDRDAPARDGATFGEWLRAHGQSERAIAVLWDLIVRPTVNLTSDEASLAQAAQVFQVGLLSDRAAGDVGHASVPLSDIHDAAARRALATAGVEVLLRCAATAISRTSQGFEIECSGAPTLAGDAVVLATPPDRAARLLPPGSGVSSVSLAALGRSPIVNLHIVFEEPVLDHPLAAAVDSPVQWLFDRTRSAGLDTGQYVVVTLSAATTELPMSIDALRELYLPALERLLGRTAPVRSFFVTRDHAATFRAGPGARSSRPGARTALPGLALAGTWTDTGWPATMESAVRSGHAAARCVLDAAGQAHMHAVTSRPTPTRDVVGGRS